MGYSLPGSSVLGILQARILEWGAIPFSRRSSQLRDWTQVSWIAGGFFTVWATREVPTHWSCFIYFNTIFSSSVLFWASLVAQLVKNAPAMRDTWVRSVSGLGRSPGEGKGYPHQYSGLENSMDCIVHGVAKRWTWLNDFHSLTQPEMSVTWSHQGSVNFNRPKTF